MMRKNKLSAIMMVLVLVMAAGADRGAQTRKLRNRNTE